MSSTQRSPRRRSARLAFEEEDSTRPSKKAKLEDNTANGVPKEHVVGRSTKPAATAAKKLKASYDEDADGFQFTRAPKIKKAPPKRRSSVKQSVPKDHRADAATEAIAPSAQRERKTRTSQEVSSANGVSPPKRRSARLSGEKVENDTTQEHDPEPLERLILPAGKEDQPRARTPQSNLLNIEKKRAPTKIALPFADTPVILRNKEMRKTSGESHRRSSSQMRGRRASSLIDSGTSNALPHSEVEVAEFYKYIHQDLPEPRRMKQLLIWCGTRALPERPSGSAEEVNAGLAARVIQEELLREFSNKSEMSDWFSRDEITPAAVIKKPNPRNIQNAAKLQELENVIKGLKQEKTHWDLLLGSLASSIEKETSETAAKINLTEQVEASSIDASLLSQPDQTALSSLTSHPAAYTSTASRLQVATESLEFKIDSFADGVHKLEKYKEAADGVVGRIMSESAKALHDRDQAATENAGTEKVGIRDLLKSLSRTA